MEELELNDLSGKKILIVEDDTTNLTLLMDFLEMSNAHILVAEDGSKAISICEQNEDIDLVLMDIMLPSLNGIEAAERIKEFRKDLPVIAQTAYLMFNSELKCKNAGCDDYIRKPIDLEELIEKMNKYLKN